ncbi:MFS-type transporter SLC18B1-like [Centruroides vittatus]|uniref:MFS-type transporter SLC18B1-like n=1 Tax=Centruroides vittatus TaxID=120091 RepID=UPI0035105148
MMTMKKNRKNLKKERNRPTKFTGLQKLIILCLCLVNFTSFLSMSIIAPFFPKEAEMKGMRESVSGIIFSVYALVLMVMSPIFGKLLPHVGSSFMFLSGVFVAGVCNILFGFLDKLTDLTLFTVFCFIVRIFEAVGAAAFTTASCTYVFSMFPDDIGTVFGIIETSIGIGMSLGPAIGGSLYALGGYGLPFFILGSVVVINIPISWLLLRNISSMPNDETSSTTYLQLLSIPKVWIVCVILMTAAQTQGFLDPTLEPHMRQYNFGPGLVGLVFLLMSAAYGVFSPLTGWVTGKMNNKYPVMIVGLGIMLVSLLVLGPAPFLPFKGSVPLCLAAVTALGISFAFAFIPSFECILLAAFEKGLGDNLVTYSKVSGLWNSVYSLGEVIGPALGGILMDFFGFPQSAVILSAFCAVAMLATFPLLCLKTPNHHKTVNEKTPLLRDNYSI